MAKDRVVLAYSGGLDTSVCLRWLMDEKGLDVICVVGEVGQEHDGYIIADEIGLPVKESGLVLPCGATALWTEKQI